MDRLLFLLIFSLGRSSALDLKPKWGDIFNGSVLFQGAAGLTRGSRLMENLARTNFSSALGQTKILVVGFQWMG